MERQPTIDLSGSDDPSHPLRLPEPERYIPEDAFSARLAISKGEAVRYIWCDIGAT